jgi:hypothetical protein
MPTPQGDGMTDAEALQLVVEERDALLRSLAQAQSLLMVLRVQMTIAAAALGDIEGDVSWKA